MKLFECQSCGHPLYFENTKCERCHHQTGYLPDLEVVSAVEPEGDNWVALADRSKLYRFCANWELHACNWMVEAESGTPLCRACQHNRTIPDISDPARFALWRRMEEAKRRLIYSLIKLKSADAVSRQRRSGAAGIRLPRRRAGTRGQDHHRPRRWDHHDLARRGRRRRARKAAHLAARAVPHACSATSATRSVTSIGTSWCATADSWRAAAPCLATRRADYGEALQRYYQNGPAPNWRENYVSAYATMHPWEDFAETWAHYLHIVDTLEMAYAFNISVSPRVAADEGLSATVDRNPYKAKDVETLIAAWLPLTFAVNSLNRSMGQPDLYPFVISAPAVTKLQYIHDLVHGKLPKRADAPVPPPASAAEASEQAPRPALRQKLSAVARRLLGGGEKNGAAA